MWSGCVKAAAGRALPPRCCVNASVRLETASRVGSNSRRTSTASVGGPRGELVEPDAKVLETLVCPFSKSPLTYDRDARELVSPVGVAFPISASGIPNMVPACARIIPANPEEGADA